MSDVAAWLDGVINGTQDDLDAQLALGPVGFRIYEDALRAAYDAARAGATQNMAEQVAGDVIDDGCRAAGGTYDGLPPR